MKERDLLSHQYEKIVTPSIFKNSLNAVKLDPDMQRDQIMALAELFLELKIDAVIATNTTVSRDKVQDHNTISRVRRPQWKTTPFTKQ